jgi:uncharacterized membrane protein YraQ (UPF0718 family)
VIIIIVTALLYVIVGILLLAALRRKDGTAKNALMFTLWDFLNLMPRLAVGIIGAGFLARVLPQDLVNTLLGPGSGLLGIAGASIAGALTPGGPVVGFALGSAALKAGAGLPQIVAFVTAWSLYTLNRILVWEVPFMPFRFVVLRIVVSLPFPFLAAWLAMLAPI